MIDIEHHITNFKDDYGVYPEAILLNQKDYINVVKDNQHINGYFNIVYYHINGKIEILCEPLSSKSNYRALGYDILYLHEGI